MVQTQRREVPLPVEENKRGFYREATFIKSKYPRKLVFGDGEEKHILSGLNCRNKAWGHESMACIFMEKLI